MDGSLMLRIDTAVVDEIRRQGERAYPAECCGVLVGIAGEMKEVLRLISTTNRRTDDPHRYLIAPDDLRRIEAELRLLGQEVLGCYHSHPDHPAVPSAFDVEQAWPWYSYLIVRVEGGHAAELASWVLEDDRSTMQSEPIDVLSEV
jgi:proteasome lid subunit RPN8/RPN11